MSRSGLPLVQLAEIVRLVGRGNLNRSYGYLRDGAVTEVTWDAVASRLTGCVQDDDDEPYDCRVGLVRGRDGFLPVDSSCGCDTGSECKHVAAVLLSTNLAHARGEVLGHAPEFRRPGGSPVLPEPDELAEEGRNRPRSAQPDSGRPERGRPERREQPAPLPDWKRAVGPPARPSAPLAIRGMTQVDGRTLGRSSNEPTTPMGLQFELREQTPLTNDRWRGPTARPAATVRPGHGGIRLGVRPVILNGKGNWVRGNLAWNKLTFQVHQLNLNPEQHRWFCELVAVHRAVRVAYSGQDADWVYLDDFASPLLWHFLGEAAVLGITFVGTRKDVTVVVGERAMVSLDATADAPREETGSVAVAVAAPHPQAAPRPQAEAGGTEAMPLGTGAEPSSGVDLHLTAVLTIDGRPHPPEHAGAIGNHGVYGYELEPRAVFSLAPTGAPLTAEQRGLLGRPATVVVPAHDVDEFMTDFYPRLRQTILLTSTDPSVRFPEIAPPTLVLTATFKPKHTLQLDWDWEYPQGSDSTRLPLLHPPDEPGSRDAPAERDLLDRAALALREAAIEPEAPRPAAPQPAPSEPAPSEPAAPARSRQPGPQRPEPLQPRSTLHGLDAAEFATKTLPRLERLPGVRVDVGGQRPDYRELTDAPRLLISTVETNQRDWFDLGVIVTIKGREIPFNPLFKALAKGHKKLLLVDGSYLSLDQPELERLHQLIDEAQALQEWDTGLRISRYQASLWADFEDLADETVQAQTWRAAVAGLLDLTAVGPAPLPAGVRATLRPYQLDGFAWLAFLWRHRLGGILADDMGLGKTLQTLALIVHAIEERDKPRDTEQPNVGIPHRERPDTAPPRSDRPHADLPTAECDRSGIDDDRPFLVVAPTSVVSNWLSEARRFAPGLEVRAITTTQAKGGAVTDAAAGADVIVTSYALFRLDFDAYQAAGWAGLILDEAQFVKNRTARVHLCAKELNAPFKLALTGTPMENNLLELWSLFSIVAPGLFPSAHRFTEEYVRPVERGENPELLARLRRRIRPLMMRRTKELVARDLPPKQEQVLRIELNPRHQKLYETVLQRERQKLLGLIEDLDKNRFIVFRSLTLLRMLSLDASLIDEKYAAIPSSKLDALFEQLEDVLAEGHRALIFSQFTSYLTKVAARLHAQGTPYCYLDGSTLRRAEVIAAFKDGSAPVFLISLKAGGFGLNLTEADYVFLLDPWWNPATEAQAVDRTHRIGQTKNVMVYRMVATGTIEEKVMALKEQKAKLFSAVLDDDAVFSSALTPDDIRALLEP